MSKKIVEKLSLGIAAILLTSISCLGSPAGESAGVQKALTIVCLGDSITRAGYPAELEKIVEARVINAGIGGNTSRQGLGRLERDVLVHKPDFVITFFGANDSRRDAPSTQVSVEEYYQNLSKIIQRCKAAGAKVILGTLPPIEPEPYYQRHPKEAYAEVGGLEKWLERYRTAALSAAASNHITGVDLYKLLSKAPGWRKPDGVHPTENGNRMLAEIFAKALQAEKSGDPRLSTVRFIPANDRSELDNLASKEPEKIRELQHPWQKQDDIERDLAREGGEPEAPRKKKVQSQ